MISLVLLMVSLLWSNLVLCGATGGLDEEQAPALTGDTSDRLFTDQWAVHIEGGDPVADLIAQRHGFVNLGKVSGFSSFSSFDDPVGTFHINRPGSARILKGSSAF